MPRVAGSLLSFWVACCVACAGRAAAPPPSPRAAQASPRATPPSTAPVTPTERQCEELITHAVVLGVDERTARKGDPPTTEADHEAVRRKLVAELGPGCRALAPEALACAMAATTLTALAACAEATHQGAQGLEDQATRSSSTSNKSVAPGGITPPAPRSP